MGMFGDSCSQVNLQPIIGANCASHEEEEALKIFSHVQIGFPPGSHFLACIQDWMRIQLEPLGREISISANLGGFPVLSSSSAFANHPYENCVIFVKL